MLSLLTMFMSMCAGAADDQQMSDDRDLALQVLASLAAAQLHPSSPCCRNYKSHHYTHDAVLLHISVCCLCIAVGVLTYHRQLVIHTSHGIDLKI